MKKSHLIAALCAITFSALSFAAHAASVTFNIAYSGVTFGNTASATGTITIDDTLLPNPGSLGIGAALPPIVQALTLTVTGATTGNGTFGISDFSTWYWDTNGGTLDLSTELVGQPTSLAPWGTTGGAGGDFNLFAATPNAPSGTGHFWLTTMNGNGDQMLLTSFSAVPMPAAVWLFGSGLIGLVGVARRSRRSK